MGASSRSSSNLPSIHHFSPPNLTPLLCFLSTKSAYNPHRWSPRCVHIQSVQVRVGLWREKCTREGKKIPLFSLLPFSSLRFQAAMPHCRSLLQATPTPTEPTGWSSSLQSEEPTAGSRQPHKKMTAARFLGNKRKQVAELPGCAAFTHVNVLGSSLDLRCFFCHVLPLFSQITELQLHSEDLIKDKQS